MSSYRCEATSLEGFIQQLAVAYVAKGYWFYVTGRVPDRKDPAAVDRKMIERYGIGISKWARARRKDLGQASIQYLRFGRFFVVLATHGNHDFFAEECDIKDVRRVPIKFGGYSVGHRGGHAHVRMDQSTYANLKSYFVDRARHRSLDNMIREFYAFPFEPWAPIRRQVFNIWREVNRVRKAAGFDLVPKEAVWLKRRPVKPFVHTQNEPGKARSFWDYSIQPGERSAES